MYEPYDWEVEDETDNRDNGYILFVLVLLFVITPFVAYLVTP